MRGDHRKTERFCKMNNSVQPLAADEFVYLAVYFTGSEINIRSDVIGDWSGDVGEYAPHLQVLLGIIEMYGDTENEQEEILDAMHSIIEIAKRIAHQNELNAELSQRLSDLQKDHDGLTGERKILH